MNYETASAVRTSVACEWGRTRGCGRWRFTTPPDTATCRSMEVLQRRRVLEGAVPNYWICSGWTSAGLSKLDGAATATTLVLLTT